MRRKLLVWEEFGAYHGQVAGSLDKETNAGTLDRLLERLAPSAPPEYVAHAAEVLEGILGPKKTGGGICCEGIVSA